jgi:S1-C subfamily serine protease
VRVGDVITRVNDTPAETVAEFRRELRRSVIWETGIFWLLRDGYRFTRIVPLADAIP